MKSTYIQLTTGPVHYLDSQGTGPTVLLLHGNSSAAAAFAAQFEVLGSRYRLIALDLPGHGQSAPTAAQHYSFAGYADALVEFVEQAHLSDYLVFGHSLGGHAALEALPRLNGIRGLGLIAAPPFNAANANLLFHPNPAEGLVFQAELDNTQVTRLARAFVNSARVEQHQLERVEHFIRTTDPQVRSALGASLGSGAFTDEVALLAASRIPVMLVQGRNDAFIDAAACSRPATFAPGHLQTVLFDGCGHCPHVEDPARFNDLMDSFITHTCEHSL